MPLENPTFIEDLNPLWPLASDTLSEGDDHTRNIKSTLQASFPGTSGAWNAPGQNLQIGGIATEQDIYVGDDLTVVRNFSVNGASQFNGSVTFSLDITCRDINARDGFFSGGIDVEGDASIRGEIRENSQVAIAGGRVDATGVFDGANFGLAQVDKVGTGIYEIQLVTGATQFKDLGFAISGSGGLGYFAYNVNEPSTNPNDGRWFRVAVSSGGTTLDLDFSVIVWDCGRD